MVYTCIHTPQELDTMKGNQRKAASSQSSMEVRLNRATEELEKYKTALAKARADSKVRNYP